MAVWTRRGWIAGSAALMALPARGQPAPAPLLGDMHSHFGLISRRDLDASGFADELRDEKVALVGWKLVADGPWLRVTSTGIEQAREPAPGELADYFARRLQAMRGYLARQRIDIVQAPADVDAALAGGAPRVVLSSEGADFLEGDVSRLAGAVGQGLRQLQLVHYIRTPVGDFQTVAPVHGGLSTMGRELVVACNAQGVLVDLAHCTGDAVDHALAASKRPMVWSHGFVDGDGGDWRDPYGFLKRRLSLAHAKRIAAAGGVIGLWALGLSRPGPPWPVGGGDRRGYARELVRLVGLLGADHVGIGTDIEGLGPNWAVNRYSHLRSVVEHLRDLGLDATAAEKVAVGNYARVLREALAPVRG